MERLRVGIDIRPLQSAGGSAERGIGRYVTDLIVGLRDHAPGIEPVLLGLQGRLVPELLSGLQVAPVTGPIFAEASKPWFAHIPKLRSSSALWGPHHRALRAELQAGMTRAVAGAHLDVLHFPTAVDVGSYPEVDSALPQVRTFLDAIPYRLRRIHYNRWPEFMQDYYREQLHSLSTARVVVSISHASAQDAHQLAKVPWDRLRVIYPAVGDRYRDLSPGPAPLGLTAKKYVLFCSVPDEHKHPEIAIRSFAQASLLQDTKLVFVCPLHRPEIPALRKLAAYHGLGDRFIITGHVPESVMPALFANALVLISPSSMEGFGLPAAQAMAAGTPVLASSSSALGEIVGGAGILAGTCETIRYAKKLRRLAEEPRYADRLAKAERARAKQFYPRRQAEKLAAVYFETAGRTSTRPSE